MSSSHHVKELREIRSSKVGHRAQSSKQTAVGYFLKVLFADVLYTTHAVYYSSQS